jgi:hypothetical protein
MNTTIISKAVSPRMAAMASPLEVWFYGLLNATLVGGASAAASALGLATASGLGVTDIQPVNWHTVSIVFTSGSLIKLMTYLSQGLPALKKNDNGEGTNQP